MPLEQPHAIPGEIPVERLMSLLNLGLQTVGLMRREMPAEYEKAINNCNSLSDLRQVAGSMSSLPTAVEDSLSPCTILLQDTFSTHYWKEQPLRSSTNAEIEQFWSVILEIDSSLVYGSSYTKKTIKNKEQVLTTAARYGITLLVSKNVVKNLAPCANLYVYPLMSIPKFITYQILPLLKITTIFPLTSCLKSQLQRKIGHQLKQQRGVVNVSLYPM